MGGTFNELMEYNPTTKIFIVYTSVCNPDHVLCLTSSTILQF